MTFYMDKVLLLRYYIRYHAVVLLRIMSKR